MTQEAKEEIIVEQKSETKFIEKFEFDAISSLEREMAETEKMYLQISIRQKQILDRVVYLDGERSKMQNNIYEKYKIEPGSNIFIKENLEIVVTPQNSIAQ